MISSYGETQANSYFSRNRNSKLTPQNWAKSAFFYATPIKPQFFLSQMDPTLWDHKSLISWGNSGYLRFSGMWRFGRSADRFMALIAQNDHFVPKSAIFASSFFCGQTTIFVSSLLKPNWHLLENRRYPELPQDMGKLWSHWVRSVWGEISGIYGRSIEKKIIVGPKCSFLAQNWFFCNIIQFFCHHDD